MQKLQFLEPTKYYLPSYLDALIEGLEVDPIDQKKIADIKSNFQEWVKKFTDTAIPVNMRDGTQDPRAPQTE